MTNQQLLVCIFRDINRPDAAQAIEFADGPFVKCSVGVGRTHALSPRGYVSHHLAHGFVTPPVEGWWFWNDVLRDVVRAYGNIRMTQQFLTELEHRQKKKGNLT
jgi:hypothetical protein